MSLSRAFCNFVFVYLCYLFSVLYLETRAPGVSFHSRSYSFRIGTLMSTNRDMQTDEETDAIPLVPYQVTNFLVQERRCSELVAQISARFAADPGRGMDPFLDNTLARAWYRNHPESREDDTRESDEVGGRHLVCFGAAVLKCRRTRVIHPKFRDGGVAHERGSPPPGYHQQ